MNKNWFNKITLFSNLNTLLKDNSFVFLTTLLGSISLLLEIYYLLFISVEYIYFDLNFSWIRFFESKLIFILISYLSYKLYKQSEFLFAIYSLLMLFFFIPNSILFAYTSSVRGVFYSNVFLLFFFVFINSINFNIQIPKLNIKNKSYFLYGIAFLFLLPIMFKFYNLSDIKLNTLLLKDIYETRTLFSLKMTRILDYFYSWEVKVIIPIVIIYSLIQKKYWVSVIAILALMYLFVISGNKIVYFATLIMLLFYFLGNTFIKKIKYFLLLLVIVLISIPYIDNIIDSHVLKGTIVMRIFYFPALLNNCYFDFFANNPLFYAENMPFKFFIPNPYSIQVAYLIAQKYFFTNDMYANNGIISDGYMNLGYIGVFINSIIFTSIFAFFNKRNIDKRYFGLFFVYIFILLSAPLLTIILTGGLGILILLAYLVL